MSLSTDAIKQIEAQLSDLQDQYERDVLNIQKAHEQEIAIEKERALQKMAAYKKEKQQFLLNQIESVAKNESVQKDEQIEYLNRLIATKKDKLIHAILEEVERKYGSF